MHATSVSVLLTMRTSLRPTSPVSVASSRNTSSRHGVPTTVVRMSRILTVPPFRVVYYARDEAVSRLLCRRRSGAAVGPGSSDAGGRHARDSRLRRVPDYGTDRRDGPDRRHACADQFPPGGTW